MRVLFLADGRSPIALNWIRYFVETGHEVHLASSFPGWVDLPLASFTFIPLAFSSLKSGQPAHTGSVKHRPGWGARTTGLRTAVRRWLSPLTLGKAARLFEAVAESVRPQLIHAMRIPYEGMAASLAERGPVPLLVSVWGNDFTLHAPATPWMRTHTRRTLSGASALHTDCFRDVRLAHAWGFSSRKPSIVLPGSGGVQMDIFAPPAARPEKPPTILNPRGFRAYVNNEAFFRAAAMVLARRPEARFLCTGMAGETRALQWVRELGLEQNVELLPLQTRTQMASLFQESHVTVSPSFHDGTPNTLLEAMACGSFPIAGDLESLREWITPGVNGLLVDSSNPQELAEAILLAMESPQLRLGAQAENTLRVAERAEYRRVMEAAEAFYKQLAAG